MAVKAKKRPCIFIEKSDCISNDDKDLTKGKKHLLSNDYIFLPIYGTDKEDERKGYPSKLVRRIRHFQYSHLAYLPDCKLKSLATGYPPKEGVVRMDRIFITHPSVPNITPTDVKISEQYMKWLLLHLKEYFFKETDDEIHDMRDLLTEELQELES